MKKYILIIILALSVCLVGVGCGSEPMTEEEQAQMEIQLQALDIGLGQMKSIEEGKWKEILGVVEEENSNILSCVCFQNLAWKNSKLHTDDILF